MGVKIFKKFKVQMSEMVGKIQKKKENDVVPKSPCVVIEEATTSSHELTDEVFVEDIGLDRSTDEVLDSSEDPSFDFRTRASFRALLFRTYTLTRSARLVRKDSLCRAHRMGFLGQIYDKKNSVSDRTRLKSVSSGTLAQ